MNSIDDKLRSQRATPGRPLSKQFTTNVQKELATHARKTRVARLKEYIRMKFFTKPVLAGIAGGAIILASGSTYAAVNGWSFSALFGGEQATPGGRIVKVDTKNCVFANAFNITSKNKQQNAYYYKVKSGSKLTNAQIVQVVQGNCASQAQMDHDSQVVNSALASNPLNKDTVVGGYADSTITALSATSISLDSEIPYGYANRPPEVKKVQQTFNRIASDVLVYDSPNTIQLSDLKVGDHVSIKYRASGEALAHSETLAPDQVDTDEQVVVAIIKNNTNYTAAVNYQKYNGTEFEQVTPCASQPSGYCTVEQYYAQQK